MGKGLEGALAKELVVFDSPPAPLYRQRGGGGTLSKGLILFVQPLDVFADVFFRGHQGLLDSFSVGDGVDDLFVFFFDH
jgi:hypothetical protein